MDRSTHARALFKKLLPLFNALGDPIRQDLYITMMDGKPRSVGELTRGTHLSRPTVSFHLKVLREAQLIKSKKQGRNVFHTVWHARYADEMQQLINVANESKGGEQ